MTVPGWWQFLLLAAAAYRLWRLLAFDSILDRWRDRAGAREIAFLECPWCSGFWVCLIWWLCWQVAPHQIEVLSVPLALSTAVGYAARADV